MNHHHRPWKPPTAAKPSHLASHRPGSSPTSLAALQGATTAFTANPKTASSTVKQLQNQYEPAHASHEITRGRSGEGHGVKENDAALQRSPSRGRHLKPEHAYQPKARTEVPSPSPPVLGSLDRTPSMIAARLASASPSPARSSAKVSPPPAPGTSNSSTEWIGRNSSPPKKYATPALIASQLSQHAAATRQTPVKSLSLDKIPRLAPKSTAVLPDKSTTSGSESREEAKPSTLKTIGSLPVPIPLRRMNTHASSLPPSEVTSRGSSQHRTERLKPLVPSPRKGQNMARSPLRANLTGPKPHQGLSREEAISRMADAMVASSLASTRPPSPAKTLPGHASRRRSASANNHLRTSSPPPSGGLGTTTQHRPQRPLKQTLRKPSAEDEEEGVDFEKRGRRHLVRKHPNMHHEGDRKRWRDKITEMERKRYEGVFAANRGLLLKPADPRASPSRMIDPNSESNQVVNVVVRDIWERSRLPEHVLEQIYDLVAPYDAPVLNREQFVVGLWLIDQKLKGRKLPVKVSESVWSSVRHSQGIKVGRRT